jgi:hypothetical protein
MYEGYVSVDLGRQHDYTAILVAEEAVWVPDPPPAPSDGAAQFVDPALWNGVGYGWRRPSALLPVQRSFFRSRNYAGARPGRPPLLVRHIERVRGRSYVNIVSEIAALLERPPLAGLATTTLVDAGGVGVAVSDLLWQQGVAHVSITATGGDHVSTADGGRTVRCPKRELVAAAQIALAEGRLRIAAGLEHAPTMIEELSNYQVKISTAGHDSYSAREGKHDDLVYAAAQLCWYRDWHTQPYDDAIARAQRPVATH